MLRRRAHSYRPISLQSVDPLEQALGQYGGGTPNVFDVRKAQLTSASAVRGALLDTKEASAQFRRVGGACLRRRSKRCPRAERLFQGADSRILAAFHRIVLVVLGRSLRRISLY